LIVQRFRAQDLHIPLESDRVARKRTLLETLVPALSPSRAARIVAGVSLGATGVLLRFAVYPQIGAKFGFVGYMPAVVMAAWFGGLVSGVLSTAVCASAAVYYMVSTGSGILSAADVLGLTVFVLTGLFLGALNELVTRSRRHAEAAIRARDEFLSVAGHELRTPLTALALQVQNLLRHRATLDGGGLDERLGRTDRYVVRLKQLVEELLDVSRVTAGRLKLELQEFDLSQLVKEVCERQTDELHNAGCTLKVEAAAAMGCWDRNRIDQVLTNLLSNAAKYGQRAPVELYVTATDGLATLRVVDHGIGIAPDEQARIFERFERAASARNYGGLGLGLWIARQIIEAHGGLLRVESVEGQGSTFIVELPRRPPAKTEQPAQSAVR
jgi:signal transduction histidine kinase